jgi:hypothetical protein
MFLFGVPEYRQGYNAQPVSIIKAFYCQDILTDTQLLSFALVCLFLNSLFVAPKYCTFINSNRLKITTNTKLVKCSLGGLDVETNRDRDRERP